MGECYYHGSEIYPGHECSECEREKLAKIYKKMCKVKHKPQNKTISKLKGDEK